MSLAHAEPAFQVQPNTRQNHPFSQQFLPARPACYGLPRQNSLQTPIAAAWVGFRRVGTVSREAHLGERWRRR